MFGRFSKTIVVSVVRTLTGHKSSIRGIDFHPYGEFVASGSLDTNVKVSRLTQYLHEHTS